MTTPLARQTALALALLGIVLSGLAGAGSAGAQARVEEKVNVAVTGDILAIDAAARSLTVKSTHDEGVVYTVAESATILKGADPLALGDLRVGWNVAMNGHDDGTRKLVTYIKVVKAP
jgi:hypothetical protein